MKVTLEAVLEGKVSLTVSAEVTTFADLSKLGTALTNKVKGVKKILPDMADNAVEKVRIVTE
jgi:hypothetical protein